MEELMYPLGSIIKVEGSLYIIAIVERLPARRIKCICLRTGNIKNGGISVQEGVNSFTEAQTKVLAGSREFTLMREGEGGVYVG